MAILSEHDWKILNQEKLASAPQPLTLWRHYKGGLYLVVCSACLEDNPERVMVVYRSLRYGSLMVRTLGNWNQVVAGTDGIEVERFRPVSEEDMK
jgi:hypothetical protein